MVEIDKRCTGGFPLYESEEGPVVRCNDALGDASRIPTDFFLSSLHDKEDDRNYRAHEDSRPK